MEKKYSPVIIANTKPGHFFLPFPLTHVRVHTHPVLARTVLAMGTIPTHWLIGALTHTTHLGRK